jgi:hypothetical protein
MSDQVYVIGNANSTTVKIGVSIDPIRRLREIQSMCPIPITLLWSCPGGTALEQSLHHEFDQFRSHGEWFTFPSDPVAAIRQAVASGVVTAPPASLPADREPLPIRNGLRLTKARALHVALSRHFQQRPFTVNEVMDVFGMPDKDVRGRLHRLVLESLVEPRGTVGGSVFGRPRRVYVVLPLPEGTNFGAPIGGARIPVPQHVGGTR